jgi:micrococcal nuclease
VNVAPGGVPPSAWTGYTPGMADRDVSWAVPAPAAADLIAAALLWLVLVLVLAPTLRARSGVVLGTVLDGRGAPRGSEAARVARAVDGDTLVLDDGRTVRIIGLDAPETHNPAMAGPQPFGEAAATRLADLVAGRVVALETDATPTDHYGRLLRHVWLGGTLVAEVLVREGLARAMSIPPDVRHAERLRAAEADARAAGHGLWSVPRPTPLPIFAGSGP